jgi:hypothetical protein
MGDKDAENYILLCKWLGDTATCVFKNDTKLSVPLEFQQHSPRETIPNTAKDTKLVGVRYSLDAANRKIPTTAGNHCPVNQDTASHCLTMYHLCTENMNPASTNSRGY